MFMNLHKSWMGFFSRSHSCYDIYNLERWLGFGWNGEQPCCSAFLGFYFRTSRNFSTGCKTGHILRS